MNARRGNILFLILLAIVLFAALSYAVTGGFRVREDTKLTEDKARTYASAMMQYASLIENSLQRMILTKDIKLEQIDWRGNFSDNSANASCTSTGNSTSCRIFHPDGGGVTSMGVPLQATDMTTDITMRSTPDESGEMQAFIISVKDVGTSLPDAVLFFRGVKAEVCDQINILGNVYSSGQGPLNENFGSHYEFFQGSASSPWPTDTFVEFGDTDARVAGKRAFCFKRSAPSTYYAVFVVYAM